MFSHLRYRSALVETKSLAGELAERVLMLNDEHSVEYRELILDVIAALEEKKRRVRETISRINRQLVSHPEQAEQLTEEMTAVERDLARLEHSLNIVAGAALP
jgi:macrodomain Ter protein organizer (MatP/YcbG family)